MKETTIKNSFSKVKEDIDNLTEKIDRISTILEKLTQNNKILPKTDQNIPKLINNEGFEAKIFKKNVISTGNEGVQSINQSTDNQSLSNHSLNIQSLQKEIENRFKKLSNQEFLVFLTIFQLEEDLQSGVTYDLLSSKLSLSAGCIRGYVSGIIKKGLPLEKRKINNRTITLHIKTEFRELKLKEMLTSMYYFNDPNQKKLLS